MKIHLLIGLFVLSTASFSQKKKKSEMYPQPTTAEQRWEGYQKRLQLEEASLIKNIPFRNIGPTVMSGRVVDLEVDPADPTHFYVAYASGSLWETVNNGTSFSPIFDRQIVMTIGDIAVNWDTKTIYVGSGENNSSRSSYSGYGIFKSSDNGETWEHLGLEESHHIGRIVLHPKDPSTVWVAALGHLYSENEQRGVFKSTDGGKTWSKTLFVNSRTGIVDLVMHPENPELLVAAAWEKDRKAWNFTEAGPGTAIFRSEDGGVTWNDIADNSGFPDTDGTGRIGLAFAPSDPMIMYAILDNQDRRKKEDKEKEDLLTKEQLRSATVAYFQQLENEDINDYLDEYNFPEKYNAAEIKKEMELDLLEPQDLVSYVEDANSLLFDTPVKGGEMYRSEDAGKTWSKTHEEYIESMIYSYGYYFGQVRVDPQDPSVVYTMGVPIVKSVDGGQTFKSINEANVHVDHHALWINPENTSHLILGNDGGVYISYDAGQNWINCNSPSVGQFYAVAVDMDKPYNVYGGLQDNGVWKAASTYEYSRRWYQEGRYPYERIMGGDGMQIAVDTRNNDVVYTGYQFGNYFRLNTATGDRKYITPKHELGDAPFRWNWEAPILISRHNQDIIYFGSNRFHRSFNKGDDFETLSDDLTLGGKKGDVSYGTLTSISESPLRFGLLYVGSDDGLVHVSKDAGETWNQVTKGLPSQFWVSTVVASHHEVGRVYASLNGYRWDNFEPMVYVSDDFGESWKPIAANLPLEPVNVVKEDPVDEDIIYVGTDHGLYVSLDRGKSYHAMVEGLPNAPVHDLVIHPRENEMVVGTHGRGIYIVDVSTLQQITGEVLEKAIHIFPFTAPTFSKRWGSRPSVWTEVDEPTLSVTYFSGIEKEGLAEILLEDHVVCTSDISAEKGINLLELSLETTSTFEDLLKDKPDQLASFEKAENGSFYLVDGDYTLRITLGDQEATQDFKIKPIKKRSNRGQVIPSSKE